MWSSGNELLNGFFARYKTNTKRSLVEKRVSIFFLFRVSSSTACCDVRVRSVCRQATLRTKLKVSRNVSWHRQNTRNKSKTLIKRNEKRQWFNWTSRIDSHTFWLCVSCERCFHFRKWLMNFAWRCGKLNQIHFTALLSKWNRNWTAIGRQKAFGKTGVRRFCSNKFW